MRSATTDGPKLWTSATIAVKGAGPLEVAERGREPAIDLPCDGGS